MLDSSINQISFLLYFSFSNVELFIVFYSTHLYTPQDFANWKSLNGIDKIMFENKMFAEGTWGHVVTTNQIVKRLKAAK